MRIRKLVLNTSMYKACTNLGGPPRDASLGFVLRQRKVGFSYYFGFRQGLGRQGTVLVLNTTLAFSKQL